MRTIASWSRSDAGMVDNREHVVRLRAGCGGSAGMAGNRERVMRAVPLLLRPDELGASGLAAVDEQVLPRHEAVRDGVATLPIVLHPGMRIGQMSFERMSSPAERPYGSAGLGSHYQGQRGAAAAHTLTR